jgi:hypothetical protein
VHRYLAFAAAAAILAAPSGAFACACGCGVFDVGDGTIAPNDGDAGVSIWVRDSYMDQNANQEGDRKASPVDNKDQRLTSDFVFVGGQYVISRDWMIMAQLPIVNRALTTTDDGTVFGPAGGRYTGRDRAIGDLDVMATYTGFDADQTTGVSFGLKLPTGDWHGPRGPLGGAEFDRDTLPGTGSTDVIVGAYHVGSLNKANTLTYFLQARYQAAFATQDGYRPGNELDWAAGLDWTLGALGPSSKVTALLQVVGSDRARDSGLNADQANTGYDRVLISPGLEVKIHKVRFLGTVEIPIWQRVNAAPVPADSSGQLVAPALFTLQAGYAF